MSLYNDKKGDSVFPTRTGNAQGGAKERQMLDSVGGSSGIRTKVHSNADGSTTTLRTRNGFPEFVTTKAGDDSEPELKFTYVGERIFHPLVPGHTTQEVYEFTVNVTLETVETVQLDLPEYLGSTGDAYKKYHRCFVWNGADGVLHYASAVDRFTTSYRRLTAEQVIPVEWKGVLYPAPRVDTGGAGAVIDVAGAYGPITVLAGATNCSGLASGTNADVLGYTYTPPNFSGDSPKFYTGDPSMMSAHYVRSPDGLKFLMVGYRYGDYSSPDKIIEWENGSMVTKYSCANYGGSTISVTPDAVFRNGQWVIAGYNGWEDFYRGVPPPVSVHSGYSTAHVEGVISANYASDGSVIPITVSSDSEVTATYVYGGGGSDNVSGTLLNTITIKRGSDTIHTFVEERRGQYTATYSEAAWCSGNKAQYVNWLNFPEEHVHLIVNQEMSSLPRTSFTQVFLHDFKKNRVFNHKFSDYVYPSGGVPAPSVTAAGYDTYGEWNGFGSTSYSMGYTSGEPAMVLNEVATPVVGGENIYYPYTNMDWSRWNYATDSTFAYDYDDGRFVRLAGSLWADKHVIICSIHALEPESTEYWTVVVFRKTGKIVRVDKPFGFQHIYSCLKKVPL